MYTRNSELSIWYMINQSELYNSFSMVCRRDEFDGFYDMIKREQ